MDPMLMSRIITPTPEKNSDANTAPMRMPVYGIATDET